jgi:23S rRNA (uracil1939-C5)-methyltransferase
VNTVNAFLPEAGTFADLFAGCGTFTGAMLARGTVDAYESAGPAVRALDKAKGPKPLRPFRRDLFRAPLSAEEANRYDAIVFDPPRVGAEDQVRALASSKVPHLIGVSCNPVTFARDARILIEGGYRLDRVGIVDQFTWSHHVELAASFRR